jgi:hypothetical protein
VPAPQRFPHCTIALYCASGSVRLDGLTAQKGELLLCRDADDSCPIRLESETGAALMAAVIYT